MSSIDLPLVARLARCAQQQGDHYLYCRVLSILAPSAPNSAEWILGYVRSLIELGLCGAARQLLSRMTVSPDVASVVAELQVVAENKTTGMADWSARRRRFKANVDALADRFPEAADMVRRSAEGLSDRYELHLCADGNAEVRMAGDPWPPRWLGGLDDHRAVAETRLNTQFRGISPPAQLFDGVGLGWEIFDGYKKTHRVFLDSSAALYVVEPNPEAVAIMFHIHDFRNVLSDARARFFVGVDCISQFRALLESSAEWPVTDRVCHSQWMADKVAGQAFETMNDIANARAVRIDQLRERISTVYADRDASWWAGRLADAADENGKAVGRPLRILGLTSRHTTFLKYSMRDCLEALESLGYETKLVMESDDHLVLHPSVALQAQADFEPDIVLILSRMRYEMTALVHESVPSVSWDQDALPSVFDESRNPTLAWNDFLMGFSAATVQQRFGWPAERLMPCPMAGGASTYDDRQLSDDELAPYRCDVSYVSHASATPVDEANHAEQWLPEGQLRTVFRHTLATMLPDWESGGPFPGDLILRTYDSIEQLGLSLVYADISKVLIALGRVGDRAFRHVALKWISEWSQKTNRQFYLWGNGWEKHPTLSCHAKGPTENGDELKKVYQASTINLQLMGYGFLHQRALDGLMATGFFMARRASADCSGTNLRRLMRMLDEHDVASSEDLARLSKQARDEIDRLLSFMGSDGRVLNPESLAGWRSACSIPDAMEVVPRFDEMSFTGATDFVTKAERFLADPHARHEQVSATRKMILEHYSYTARMRQMIRFVGEGFASQSQRSAGGLNDRLSLTM